MKTIKRMANVYNIGGYKRIADVLGQKVKSYYLKTLISWVRYQLIRDVVRKNHRPIPPAILILSLPRSGSSWVGDILGSSDNAMYLREPVTQGYKANNKDVGTVFKIDPSDPPVDYKEAADNAFDGIPAFTEDIVRFPEQWSLIGRKSKRVVIKEVNPYACEFYLNTYAPRVIFLVRHPAAIAYSYKRLNWWPSVDDEFYQKHGEFQGESLLAAYKCLKDYPDHKVVRYEDVCSNPTEVFIDMFHFAQLNWDLFTENSVRKHSLIGDRSIHWTTFRNSKEMIGAWRPEIGNNELECLRDAYFKFDLPWYKLEEDW
jgi:hypothetical protein